MRTRLRPDPSVDEPLLCIWRDFRIEVPDAWEMLSYSCNPESGRCAFADRYQYRLELSWQRAVQPPDFDRLVQDSCGRLSQQGVQEEELTPLTWGAWRGLEAWQNNWASTRVARHFGGEECLLELVFLWPGRPDEALARTIVASVAPTPPSPAGTRRWRAFGMDLEVPEGLTLQTCEALPAQAELVFAAGKQEMRYGRRGLVQEWLRGSIADWLRLQLPAGAESDELPQTTQYEEHSITSLSARHRPVGLWNLFAPAVHYAAAAWLCPSDNRLYSIICRGGAAPHHPALAGGLLRCCTAWRERPHG